MIIANRILAIQNSGSNIPVVTRIFCPERDGEAWICRYEIDWPERTRKSFSAGLDSVQALHLALQKISVDLYMSEYHRSGQLMWLNPDEGYGFPAPKNGRDFLVGLDKEFDG